MTSGLKDKEDASLGVRVLQLDGESNSLEYSSSTREVFWNPSTYWSTAPPSCDKNLHLLHSGLFQSPVFIFCLMGNDVGKVFTKE